jgi:hypothetical protein
VGSCYRTPSANSQYLDNTVTSACNLVQVISQLTRVFTNSPEIKLTCIDHIFAKMCFKAVSKSIGCSDDNIIAISKKTKVPKARPKSI